MPHYMSEICKECGSTKTLLSSYEDSIGGNLALVEQFNCHDCGLKVTEIVQKYLDGRDILLRKGGIYDG